MVRLIFALITLIVPIQAISQTITNYEIHIDTAHLTDAKYQSFLANRKLRENGWLITTALQPPIFNGDLKEFIKENLNNHYISDKCNTNISVWVYFEIDTLGNTFNHQVIRTTDIHSEYSDEALRVCSLIKFDKPAYNNKNSMYCNYVVLVKFGNE